MATKDWRYIVQFDDKTLKLKGTTAEEALRKYAESGNESYAALLARLHTAGTVYEKPPHCGTQHQVDTMQLVARHLARDAVASARESGSLTSLGEQYRVNPELLGDTSLTVAAVTESLLRLTEEQLLAMLTQGQMPLIFPGSTTVRTAY